MITENNCKFAYMNTYNERLKQAMEEAGFDGRGGQSKLAREVGMRSQTINQVLKGSSKELSALFHVRVCLRLGISPLWLSEGKGAKRSSYVLNPNHLSVNDVQGVDYTVSKTQDFGWEDELLQAVRKCSPAFQAAIVNLLQAAVAEAA